MAKSKCSPATIFLHSRCADTPPAVPSSRSHHHCLIAIPTRTTIQASARAALYGSNSKVIGYERSQNASPTTADPSTSTTSGRGDGRYARVTDDHPIWVTVDLTGTVIVKDGEAGEMRAELVATAQLNRQMPGFPTRLERVLNGRSLQKTLASLDARVKTIDIFGPIAVEVFGEQFHRGVVTVCNCGCRSV